MVTTARTSPLCKMTSYLHITACFLQIYTASAQVFKEPDFISDWLYVRAQDATFSELDVAHGLGVVPVFVDVLVRAIDGPNANYAFKAMGNGGRDDDTSDLYGGVVYIYNHENVKILAPHRGNQASSGGVIYTGDSPYWTGVNVQYSLEAEVQIRCWLSASIPSPCFSSFGTRIVSQASGQAYAEISHGLGRYPQMVRVRTKLTNGQLSGWYSDGQGSSMGVQAGQWRHSGGVKYGYNNSTIRVWTISLAQYGSYLFSAFDGWGRRQWVYYATTGEIDVHMWCDLGVSTIYTRNIGPSVLNEELEIQFPVPVLHDNTLVSLMVRVEDGANAGYMFEGVGSSKSSDYIFSKDPCGYGGIIYAYSENSVRLWRPNSPIGAAICINEAYADRTNIQAATDVTVIIVIRKIHGLSLLPMYQPWIELCLHFQRIGENASYNGSYFEQNTNVTSLMTCHHTCRSTEDCTTLSYKNDTCSLFSDFDNALVSTDTGSEVWTLASGEV